MLQKQHSDS